MPEFFTKQLPDDNWTPSTKASGDSHSAMKDVIILSLSSTNGTRHIALTIKRRNALLAAVLGFAVLLLGMFGYIQFLQWQTDDIREQLTTHRQSLELLSTQLSNARVAYDEVAEQRQLLETTIARKTEQLSAMSERMDSLEDKLDNGISAENVSLEQRIDLASLAISSREVTLNLIPNGDPINYLYVSSTFGKRMHPIRGRVIFHAGIDLAANIKTPVYATADGVVEMVSHRHTGYGNMILVSHAFGFKSRYAHLKTIKVKRGAFVRKGDLIAYSGNSGDSTGPHLHYEVTYAGKPLNPKPFLNWRLDNYEQVFSAEKQVPWPSLIATIESLRNMWQQPLSPEEHTSGASSSSVAISTLTERLKEKSTLIMPFVLEKTAR